MKSLALVTTAASLQIDYDMPLLIDACKARGLNVDVCDWRDPDVDWQHYAAVVLRSPWDYYERLQEFLDWCRHVTSVSELLNPLPAVSWSLDKHYLSDLAAHDVPVVPTIFIEIGNCAEPAIRKLLSDHPEAEGFVAKPTIGCYSRGVQRFLRTEQQRAAAHVNALHRSGNGALIQPYQSSIDEDGETNLIFFDDHYSHAIRKAALLAADGTVNAPSYDFRSSRDASRDEQDVALAALRAARKHLKLTRPLLYGRVDLLRGADGSPRLIELEIAEPSLSLTFSAAGADRFAAALGNVLRNI